MSEEVKEVTETETAPIVPAKKTPEEIDKEKQGERATKKKKVNKFNKAESLEELKRLKRGGHEQSAYYTHVLERAQQL